MNGAILTLNAGSSSLKFGLFAVAPGSAPALHARGQIEGVGQNPHFTARDAAGAVVGERRWPDAADAPHERFLADLIAWAEAHLGGARLAAVGHRVVHGGAAFTRPVLVDASVLERLAALAPLAPLHQPHNLAAIAAVTAARPGLPQVACFDTAFHASQPAVATRLALPRAFAAEGVRRYGFHGLSYEHLAGRLAVDYSRLAAGRVIAAHLGAGASLCALSAGVSVDTTMGFTALDGLVMATRCGALDPGAVTWLMRVRGLDAQAIEDLLYRRSGLLGVSGLTGDMRDLLASDAPEAREAVELYIYRLVREAGALAAVLGGLDGLVFTAGVGENAPAIRARACAGLAWLGVELDPARNAAGAEVISASGSAVTVLVMPADEEGMVARHVAAILAAPAGGG